jgi:poly-gamma-glutamate biosynthesis protein PgsC/CapC
MIDILPVAIGVGLVTSLLFTELFGLAAGGMVVPGYIALNLTRPISVAFTIGAGFLTFVIVHALSSVVTLYGRRRTALMILCGYIIGALVRNVVGGAAVDDTEAWAVIGFIIPGLIAIWMSRQGVVETTASILTVSVVVRMVLILVGEDLPV